MQHLQHLLAVLTGCRDVTADLGKDFDAICRAKTSRHFLFQFDHAEIAFRLVVVKRHLKIVHKSQHEPLAGPEMIEQVLGRMLLGLASFFGEWRCRFG